MHKILTFHVFNLFCFCVCLQLGIPVYVYLLPIDKTIYHYAFTTSIQFKVLSQSLQNVQVYNVQCAYIRMQQCYFLVSRCRWWQHVNTMGFHSAFSLEIK